MKLAILAAGKSERIFNKIKKHKCLIEINGKSIIQNIIHNAKKNKIVDIDVVIGFKGKNIKNHLRDYKNINFINNKLFNSKDMMHSLYLSLKSSNKDTIICYSDIYFESDIFKKIIKKANDQSILIPVLTNWKRVWKIRNKLQKNDAEDLKIDKDNNILNIGQRIKKNSLPKYQFMGLVFIPLKLKDEILKLYHNIKTNKKLHTTNFLDYLIKKKINIKALKYKKKWYEFDDNEDFLNFKKYKW